MKVLDIPGSGKCGVIVRQGGRFGQFNRTLAIPSNPRSTAQLAVRNRLTTEARAWRALTQDQRNAWIEAAKAQGTKKRMRTNGALTGLQLFVRVNCNLLLIGQPTVSDPPDIPNFAPSPCTGLVVTNTGGTIAVKLAAGSDWNDYTIVRACAPLSQGIQVCNDFRVLGQPPAPAQGFSTITTLYANKFGAPSVGSKVFVQVQQIINGYEDLPTQFEAIVPAHSAWQACSPAPSQAPCSHSGTAGRVPAGGQISACGIRVSPPRTISRHAATHHRSSGQQPCGG
jgi:hypothetical protein